MCVFRPFFNFREHLIKLLQDEALVRDKYYRQLESITQKINSIPLPTTPDLVSLIFEIDDPKSPIWPNDHFQHKAIRKSILLSFRRIFSRSNFPILLEPFKVESANFFPIVAPMAYLLWKSHAFHCDVCLARVRYTSTC